MSDSSDETLIQRYRAGHAGAFDQLYARYRQPLFSYLHRQVNQQGLAEDLFQDIWMRVINNLEQWQDDGHFKAWLFRVAHNRLIDHWRAQKPAAADAEDDIQSAQPWPERWALLSQCVELLFKLLAGLNPQQRDAFVLQQESGLTLEQIASVCGCNRETVKSRLRYAVQRLRQGLEGCDD